MQCTCSLEAAEHNPAQLIQVNASGKKKVTAILEDGRRFEGDILIGADGIWSKVRFLHWTQIFVLHWILTRRYCRKWIRTASCLLSSN